MQEKFDEFYKDLWRGNNEAHPVPESVGPVELSIPNEGTLYDYVFVYRQKGAWKHWPELLRSVKMIETINIQQMVVPTVESVKYAHLLEMHVRHGVPFLLVGPTGTGKSFYIQDLLMNKLDQAQYLPAFLTFTAQTSANQTQELVLSKLHKRRRGQYGAPPGKKCVIFVDDMNMPQKEVYGAQPAIETALVDDLCGDPRVVGALHALAQIPILAAHHVEGLHIDHDITTHRDGAE